MIRPIGRTELRVVFALVVTAVLPLLTATWLANQIVHQVSSAAFQPEFGSHLTRSLGVYKDLVTSMKRSMRSEAALIAGRPALREAAASGDGLDRALLEALTEHSELLSLEVTNIDGERLSFVERERPIDLERERPFAVHHALGSEDGGQSLAAVFAASRSRLDEMDDAQEFVQGWYAFADKHRGELVERPYLYAFALLLGITVVFAVIVGVFVVRPVTRRINQLAAATKPVAEGDLSVRVDDEGRDEIAALAQAFNNMLDRLGESRARVEFLKRVGEWQSMARRLAHEIKNPLTPIQLAVEECHGRYDGSDEGFLRLLDTTHDIVVEEVASLRRLVGEFAEFARLPRAALRHGDVAGFLLEQEPRLVREAVPHQGDAPSVDLEMSVGDGDMPVALDRTMLYRVLSNLVANGVQAALADQGPGRARVRVSAELVGQSRCSISVEDSGAGVPRAKRQSIFDPYVTTKKEGTGLGLTIVKKVVIDHGGQIDVEDSSLGGALFRIWLPLRGSPASDVAVAQSQVAPLSG